MSAICGIYYRNNKIDMNEANKVMNYFNKYKFDASQVWSSESLFLGCHLNHVVPENIGEILPFHDSESSLVITADAIIDNREELFKLLSIPNQQRDICDSILILKAFKKWGKDCSKYLVGDFAYAIYDEKKKELFCSRDHVGKRTFYYYHSKDMFVFSTLIKLIFKIKSIKKELNETYVGDFLAIPAVTSEIDPTITIYNEIFQLPPASSMIVDKDGMRIWEYWKIERTKDIEFNSDEECEEAFRKVFFEAVRCRMRSIKKVGVMLSGGLDSGSVACIASNEMKNKGEELYSFTQVPMEGYKDWLPKNKLADEREYVEEVIDFTGNITPFYVVCEGKSPLTEIDFRIDCIEQPYKNFQNSYWMNEILRETSIKSLGILLDGQSGNATISWGNFNSYIYYLIKKGDLKTYFNELKAYSNLNNKKLFRLVVGSVLQLMPYGVKKFIYEAKWGKEQIKLLSPINPKFYDEMNVKERFKKLNYDPLFINSINSFDKRMNLLKTASFSNIGAMETKISMAFGIIRRDPTRDKRLIEFCINIPENQWVRNGNERRFIRHAMKGFIPDKVRLNTSVRGKQAADWLQRIEPQWQDVCEEIKNIGELELERRYLDVDKIKKYLINNKALDFTKGDNAEVSLLIRALIFSRFLRKNF